MHSDETADVLVSCSSSTRVFCVSERTGGKRVVVRPAGRLFGRTLSLDGRGNQV